jgi:arsenite methyltransferase
VATRSDLRELLAERGVEACCAALYESHAVRWFLGGELHPGGAATTRRSLEMIELRASERLLDVGSGAGTSALLAAREFGCLVAGVDYGTGAIVDAQRAADAAGLCDRVGFMQGEAGALPFADGVFDAVLCECSLSTFENKPRAVAEMRRVLRPGGRVAISDVVADPGRLPETLRGRVATLGCIGGAMPLSDYQRLLAEHGLRTYAIEPLDAEAGRLAGRLEDRLRFGRIMDRCRANRELCPFGFDEAIAAVRLARRAIDERLLGYAIITAVR